ncbi:hypothetical protein [Paractinoplanes globisporus]|uniref:Uncharacterized protein n=1 Tax=Paractinoplanes globisporus TaxID=113565 RepID=A0ABW6WIE7_9ACTN|nr:hypothetical protein [Actinoplanes globisporus]
MQALETKHRLLNFGLTTTGRQRRDYDKLTLLAEDSNPDAQARYAIADEQCFALPREFFTNLWIFTLTDTELACYLALRWAQQQAPMADRASFVIVSQERETRLRLKRPTWDSVERLQAYGLIRRTDDTHRNPVTGTIESFRDRWQAGEVATPHYAFTLDGVQRPALAVVRLALENPVAPAWGEMLELDVLGPATAAVPRA